MLVSFTEPIPEQALEEYVADVRSVMEETGVVRESWAQRHIPVAGEEAIPAFIATVVLQFSVDDEADLATLFAAPRAGEIIHAWQARYPYEVAWVNYEAIA
ncbi:hypothetical protein [Amnibacterium kyonggiense]